MKKVKGWINVLSFFTVIGLGWHLIHLFLLWPDIPNHIEVHFTNNGPDRWGTKYFLLIIPAIGILLWWLFGKLTNHPEKFNYINLTDKNRKKQYEMASSMMVIIKNLVLFTFIFANESFLRINIGTNDSILFALSICSLASILLVVLYNVIWAIGLKE